MLHRFLVWLGLGALALPSTLLLTYAALAQVHAPVALWGERIFTEWWPTMTAGWFLLGVFMFLSAYIGAIVYTGGNKEKRMKATDKWIGNGSPRRQLPTNDAPAMLIGCGAIDCGGDGINAQSDVRVRGFTAIGNGGHGIRIGRGAKADIKDVNAQNNKGHGLSIDGDDDERE